jgi:hypothetical protein
MLSSSGDLRVKRGGLGKHDCRDGAFGSECRSSCPGSLPGLTTAEVEELTAAIAARFTDRLAPASEDRGDGLDPDLAAIAEALP